jgi:hypothetical protein
MKQLMMMVVIAGIALLAPAAARAHEGHMHKALGTVSSIEGQHLVVKTTDGKSLTVMLDKETAITRGKDKLDVSALKIGERLSVDYMEEKGMNMAHGVKLGTATAAAARK